MLSFDKTWFEEIGEITSDAEYQTCEVEFTDPAKVSVKHNPDTGEKTVVKQPGSVLYSGQARLIAVRRGVNYEGATQKNSKTITGIRVQTPMKSLPFSVVKSMKAVVTSASYNPTLERYVFTLSSDIHGSSAAARTFEFNVDGDSQNG